MLFKSPIKMNLNEIIHFDKKYLNNLVKNILETRNKNDLDELLEYIIGKDYDDGKNRPFYSSTERDFIRFILVYSIIDYRDAKRKSGEFYAIHPIETAKLVDRASRAACKIGDPIAIAVALLHDSIEERADRLDFTADEYNEKINVLFENAKNSLENLAKNSELLEEYKKEADALVVDGMNLLIENSIETIISVTEKLTRIPSRHFYDYIKDIFFPKQPEPRENTETGIIVKIPDRTNNISDMGNAFFSDFHKVYSVYKNLYVMHMTRDYYYSQKEQSTNMHIISALDTKLKEVCVAVLDDIIERLGPLVGNEFYQESVEEVIGYIKTPSFRKITEATESTDPEKSVYTFDGRIYRYNDYLQSKKPFRNEEGNIYQVLRDALLMRALVWGYVLDPKFRLEGFEDIGENGS